MDEPERFIATIGDKVMVLGLPEYARGNRSIFGRRGRFQGNLGTVVKPLEKGQDYMNTEISLDENQPLDFYYVKLDQNNIVPMVRTQEELENLEKPWRIPAYNVRKHNKGSGE